MLNFHVGRVYNHFARQPNFMTIQSSATDTKLLGCAQGSQSWNNKCYTVNIAPFHFNLHNIPREATR